MNDTGLCAPESIETLLRQQAQLRAGVRDVQMFPLGTEELECPDGLGRFANTRGVFHYRPEKISADEIERLSACGQENVFLNLGPFSKPEIARRILAGEKFACVTEYAPNGAEIRCAGGTDKTIAEQVAYFESTKEPDSRIVVGAPPVRVMVRLNEGHS